MTVFYKLILGPDIKYFSPCKMIENLNFRWLFPRPCGFFISSTLCLVYLCEHVHLCAYPWVGEHESESECDGQMKTLRVGLQFPFFWGLSPSWCVSFQGFPSL